MMMNTQRAGRGDRGGRTGGGDQGGGIKKLNDGDESCKASSYREASRQIAEETGETEAAVECRIRRGKNELRQPDAEKSKPQRSLTVTPEAQNPNGHNRLTDSGGARPGA